MRQPLEFSAVVDLACEAGRAIMAIYDGTESTHADVHFKSDNSPLTAADLASHSVICQGLQALYPGMRVVSEEDEIHCDRALLESEFWLIDPLDGTKEFMARNGEFTVNIALISDGAPVWGVVCAPALEQVYWGGENSGAFRRMAEHVESIRVSESAGQRAVCRVVASKSHLNHETAEFIRLLGEVELMQAGSSLKLCLVAEGTADIYPRLAPTCEWDTAAAQAVVEAAGGFVVDTNGDRVRYGKQSVLNPHFIASAKPISCMVKA